MKLILIRHADPDYENDALTVAGHEQASLLAESLRFTVIDRIYASPAGRAQLTAGYTARRRNQAVQTLEWINELDGSYGENTCAWELNGVDAFAASRNFTVDGWAKEAVYGSRLLRVADTVWKNFDRFMEELGYWRNGLRYDGARGTRETIAFFCHKGFMLTLLPHLLNLPLPLVYAQFNCDPSNVTILETADKDGHAVFKLVCLNDLSHTRLPHADPNP